MTPAEELLQLLQIWSALQHIEDNKFILLNSRKTFRVLHFTKRWLDSIVKEIAKEIQANIEPNK